ncbi:unnamed protein product [Brachionus calyciflorus]|uniref:Uncharacterized protein n=1 Tax=Brachionus calyciflorus TaxID=104777 RepID=A0A813WV46_9BILA|nr:unnamed protein product [Brachionus calyciflorus]
MAKNINKFKDFNYIDNNQVRSSDLNIQSETDEQSNVSKTLKIVVNQTNDEKNVNAFEEQIILYVDRKFNEQMLKSENWTNNVVVKRFYNSMESLQNYRHDRNFKYKYNQNEFNKSRRLNSQGLRVEETLEEASEVVEVSSILTPRN